MSEVERPCVKRARVERWLKAARLERNQMFTLLCEAYINVLDKNEALKEELKAARREHQGFLY